MLIKAAFIWSKIQKIIYIVKYYYDVKQRSSILIYIKNLIYFCDQSWIFSIITPVFSVT